MRFELDDVLSATQTLLFMVDCLRSSVRRLRRRRDARCAWFFLLAAAIASGSPLLSGAEPPAKPPAVGPRHARDMAKGLELFRNEIRALLVERCVRCHGGESVRGELDLTRRESLLAGGKTGAVVVPGASGKSLLFRLIAHEKKPHMPRGGPRLGEAEIAAVARWIDLGAPYDRPLVTAQAEGEGLTVGATDREFWAFRPLERAAPPEVEASWCRGPIDRFVLGKLRDRELEPSRAAERRKLIRRLFLDVVGVPPEPEEVAAFLMDSSPDAYERVVDRLLADPGFGERWGRHWLDLARFAESHGFEHDTDREYAYHYRDFVIRAFNRDQPYDEFVEWQLAGDEVAPDEPDAMAATGFLAAGVHATQITANQVEKERYDELDDITNTLGTAFLGLSIGCARCHDHKYDPIPTSDYYRLLSTFTTTVRSDYDVVLNAGEYRAELERFYTTHRPFEKALERFEEERLPARFEEWLTRADVSADDYRWYASDVVSMRSQVGADFTELTDGSIYVSGNNGIKDTYTFVLESKLSTITGARIDALPHGVFPGGGPGRGEGGKFTFNRLSVTAEPLLGADVAAGAEPSVRSAARPVTLEFGKETYVEGGSPIPYPGKPRERIQWIVTEQLGRRHTILIRFPEPVRSEHGSRLVFELGFRREYQGNMGRPRVSLTDGDPFSLVESGVVPERLRPALARVAAREGASLDAASREQLETWYRVVDPGWRELEETRQRHLGTQPRPRTAKMLISSEGVAPLRLNTQGADFFEETYFLKRGDPNQKLGVARQAFLQVLTRAEGATPIVAAEHWQEPPPAGVRLSYRRRALASWLTDVDRGAGNLLARVIVNRLWQHLMGRGIVPTPSDFGAQGGPPSHPELLETLALQLLEEDWRLKPLLRTLLTSATYRQSAASDPKRAARDPENRWFWRRTPRRLEAEAVRDSLLAVGGLLERRMYGKGTLDDDHRRRSIYFTVKRSELVPMMTVFDAPDALQGVPVRSVTTVAPQALFLLNSPAARRAALSFAQRVASVGDDPAKQVAAAFEIAFSRRPGDSERAAAESFLAEQKASYAEVSGGAAGREALADLCQSLLSLNEFIYVD